MGSTIKKMTTAKRQVGDLKKDLNNYSAKLIEAKDALNTMMKGDGTDAYWQGEAAAKWYQNAIQKINKMMGNYNNSYDEFVDYAKVIDKAETKRKFKGSGKAAIKALVAQANGSQYTSGTKYKNMDKEKISATLPGTVNTDTVNDDQTKASYRSYLKLVNALNSLINICNTMKTDWSNIANNTKGTMHTDAGKRNKYMDNRKKEIESCRDSLTQDYIGDILFSR